MAKGMTTELRGLDRVESYFREFPQHSKSAARISINATVRFAARLASKRIRSQVAFKRSYLGDAANADSKLRIARYASTSDLSASLVSRDRPTSLARFSTAAPTFGVRRKGQRGPRVRIKGATRVLPKAFFVKLRRGSIITEDSFNIGLAIRLPKGQKPSHTTRATRLDAKGAWLLYGPSVAQVFNGVRDDIAPEVADFAALEFLRQFERAARG